jgi:hypothetical protein
VADQQTLDGGPQREAHVKIDSVDLLQEHLASAVALEHSTVPLYLYAYYSVEDPLSAAAQTMRSVVMQEMAHVCLATNLLVAVGGEPHFDEATFVPRYPSLMAHHEPPLMLHLQPASVAVVREVFCAIERPMTVRDVPEAGGFTTIGQFYAAIAAGFRGLVAKLGSAAVFTGRRGRQLTTGYHGGYAGATGTLVEVHDLASALRALNEIVRQGEGTAHGQDDEPGDLAHYWRFNQIVDTTTPLGSVLPVVTDPSTESLPPGPLRDLSALFDAAYALLLRLMQRVWDDESPSRAGLIAALVPLMVRVLKPIAAILVTIPIEGRGVNAGPSFAYSTTSQADILAACERLAATYPRLNAVAQALHHLPLIDLPVAV